MLQSFTSCEVGWSIDWNNLDWVMQHTALLSWWQSGQRQWMSYGKFGHRAVEGEQNLFIITLWSRCLEATTIFKVWSIFSHFYLEWVSEYRQSSHIKSLPTFFLRPDPQLLRVQNHGVYTEFWWPGGSGGQKNPWAGENLDITILFNS